ncbi:probable LRR receptor-like serine/threonine-protein kinase At1g74360 [Olea europaea var. sylvestris]|uniref:non-specific serine/threonine protein kinase n=1 Tax=Olea europaea subsp. europaea TaxID=158383 RepID=A0A8S0TW13_OLEEU|nr:probable LRR receptor-like serine/threonine-protein kinase At1g74360 [Olea europaea var. sylvestris]CAA3010378.1 probable LRR receptor-like serine threonine-kinase At1g74360 [Olea europaea subsp. europaea]
MSEEEADKFFCFALFNLLILITGKLAVGDSLETDRQVLLQLRSLLSEQNPVNQGRYTQWNPRDDSPCDWPGIMCDNLENRVTRVDLSGCKMSGNISTNFSALKQLSYLDLSQNTIGGIGLEDLARCVNLKFLNLSHNIITGEFNLTGLSSLEILDLSLNRIIGHIELAIPQNCQNLKVVNISSNNLTGEVGSIFKKCWNLKYLDLSSNNLTGDIWRGSDRLEEFSVAQNNFSGKVPSGIFTRNCSLRSFDLSENHFFGEFPAEIFRCKDLEVLTLRENNFTGLIPEEIGSLSSLVALYLGNNNFSREIPESLTNLSSLVFLDLSRNNFGGAIQDIFGRLVQVKFLLLHVNSYTGGLYSSRILQLPNITRLDLSFNNFSGPLPVEISRMTSLRFLVLAHNHFTGNIPSEYGNLKGLQALDLSFNQLNGPIPKSLGNLTSLLWLMFANNSLTGEIPSELGNCSSLLWLNLANNQLSGKIPPELTNIGKNVTPTFLKNRQNDKITAGSGECLTMMRWIPADYPPFSFIYKLLTKKKCRSLWDQILKGYGLLSVCLPGTNIRTLQISGYVQLSGNQLSGEVPLEIGNMLNFSMVNLACNQLYGKFPPKIGRLPLIVLNVSQNNFSGEIPWQIGNLKCLQNLDLSYNNFSGSFPISLNNLNDLSKFNVSYNPYVSGVIPTTGQLSTFEKWSFLGDPLLHLPSFINNTTNNNSGNKNGKAKRTTELGATLVVLALILTFLVCGLVSVIVCLLVKSPVDAPGYLLKDLKAQLEFAASSDASSPWLSGMVKVIRLDRTTFTHDDILKATWSFSENRIIGRGGSGTVYRGVLPDGRQVAVKKLQREGLEGEREFRAEMEVLSGNGFGWPHPNLVKLYGWCLDGSEKLLVYEYMEGGSLEDLITDRIHLNWRRRIDVAVDVASALVYLHHECFPSIVHRDVKASNVLLDKTGKACVTDFGLARVVDAGGSHVSTMVAGTIGYVAPEYGQTWQATTKGDVYSYGVLAMELATGRRAVDGDEECLVEWGKRVMGDGRQGFTSNVIPVALLVSGQAEGEKYMCELLRIGILCTAEKPHSRPNMKQVLAMLIRISGSQMDCSPDKCQ